MPVSILTPIATELCISEGAAGQAIAVSGLFAVLTSLPLSMLIRERDRRLLLGLWGLVGTALPVAWWTWLSRTLPRDAEAGGGLLFDLGGHHATFLASAVLLAASAIVGVLDARRFPYDRAV